MVCPDFCTLIVTAVQYFIILMSSALYPEDTCKEAQYSWVFVVKLLRLRGSIYFFAKLPPMMLPADILKASHASTKTEFMW